MSEISRAATPLAGQPADTRPVDDPALATSSVSNDETLPAEGGAASAEGSTASTETHGSDARPPRPLDGSLRHIDLAATFARLRAEDAFRSDGRNSETVVSDGPTRVIVTVADGGRDVGADTNDGHVSILLLEGAGRVVRGAEETAVAAGALVILAPGSAWSLRLDGPSAFVASFWQPA
jgi:hypothetical protein